MIVWTEALIAAMLGELQQRYRLGRVLGEVASDLRRLDDLGLALADIEAELRQVQRRDSPLRAWKRQLRLARRMAHQRGWH